MSAMNDKIMLFVKFGEEKYVRRLFNGRIYFSNAVKFRGIEKENGLKGQGDAFEAILQLKNGYAIMTQKKHLFFALLAYQKMIMRFKKKTGRSL